MYVVLKAGVVPAKSVNMLRSLTWHKLRAILLVRRGEVREIFSGLKKLELVRMLPLAKGHNLPYLTTGVTYRYLPIETDFQDFLLIRKQRFWLICVELSPFNRKSWKNKGDSDRCSQHVATWYAATDSEAQWVLHCFRMRYSKSLYIRLCVTKTAADYQFTEPTQGSFLQSSRGRCQILISYSFN